MKKKIEDLKTCPLNITEFGSGYGASAINLLEILQDCKLKKSKIYLVELN